MRKYKMKNRDEFKTHDEWCRYVEYSYKADLRDLLTHYGAYLSAMDIHKQLESKSRCWKEYAEDKILD